MVTDLQNNVPSETTYRGGYFQNATFSERLTYLVDNYESDFMSTETYNDRHVITSIMANKKLPIFPHLAAIHFNYSLTFDLLEPNGSLYVVDTDEHCTDSILSYFGAYSQPFSRDGSQSRWQHFIKRYSYDQSYIFKHVGIMYYHKFNTYMFSHSELTKFWIILNEENEHASLIEGEYFRLKSEPATFFYYNHCNYYGKKKQWVVKSGSAKSSDAEVAPLEPKSSPRKSYAEATSSDSEDDKSVGWKEKSTKNPKIKTRSPRKSVDVPVKVAVVVVEQSKAVEKPEPSVAQPEVEKHDSDSEVSRELKRAVRRDEAVDDLLGVSPPTKPEREEVRKSPVSKPNTDKRDRKKRETKKEKQRKNHPERVVDNKPLEDLVKFSKQFGKRESPKSTCSVDLGFASHLKLALSGSKILREGYSAADGRYWFEINGARLPHVKLPWLARYAPNGKFPSVLDQLQSAEKLALIFRPFKVDINQVTILRGKNFWFKNTFNAMYVYCLESLKEPSWEDVTPEQWDSLNLNWIQSNNKFDDIVSNLLTKQSFAQQRAHELEMKKQEAANLPARDEFDSLKQGETSSEDSDSEEEEVAEEKKSGVPNLADLFSNIVASKLSGKTRDSALYDSDEEDQAPEVYDILFPEVAMCREDYEDLQDSTQHIISKNRKSLDQFLSQEKSFDISQSYQNIGNPIIPKKKVEISKPLPSEESDMFTAPETNLVKTKLNPASIVFSDKVEFPEFFTELREEMGFAINSSKTSNDSFDRLASERMIKRSLFKLESDDESDVESSSESEYEVPNNTNSGNEAPDEFENNEPGEVGKVSLQPQTPQAVEGDDFQPPSAPALDMKTGIYRNSPHFIKANLKHIANKEEVRWTDLIMWTPEEMELHYLRWIAFIRSTPMVEGSNGRKGLCAHIDIEKTPFDALRSLWLEQVVKRLVFSGYKHWDRDVHYIHHMWVEVDTLEPLDALLSWVPTEFEYWTATHEDSIFKGMPYYLAGKYARKAYAYLFTWDTKDRDLDKYRRGKEIKHYISDKDGSRIRVKFSKQSLKKASKDAEDERPVPLRFGDVVYEHESVVAHFKMKDCRSTYTRIVKKLEFEGKMHKNKKPWLLSRINLKFWDTVNNVTKRLTGKHRLHPMPVIESKMRIDYAKFLNIMSGQAIAPSLKPEARKAIIERNITRMTQVNSAGLRNVENLNENIDANTIYVANFVNDCAIHASIRKQEVISHNLPGGAKNSLRVGPECY